MHFQDIILTLQNFWTHGIRRPDGSLAGGQCILVQPYNSEVGAGTFNPATFLRAIDTFSTLTADKPAQFEPGTIKHVESETYGQATLITIPPQTVQEAKR